MADSAELVSLHVGGAGIGLAGPLWDLYCREHGCPGRTGAFFTSPTGHPRALIIDMDRQCVDQFRTTYEKELWGNLMSISGEEDSASLFSRGRYSQEAQNALMLTTAAIRSLAEKSDNLHGFVLHNSLGGGTGSGLTSLICDRMCLEYAKKDILQFSLFPSDNTYGSVLEPYNVVLSLAQAGDSRKCTVVVDNISMNKVLQYRGGNTRATLNDANRLWASTVGAVTCNMRLEGESYLRISDLLTTMVAYPELRYCAVNYSPIGKEKCDSPASLVNTCFHPDMQMLDINVASGSFSSGAMFLRGSASAGQYTAQVGHLVSTGSLPWVHWSSACCRIYTCTTAPTPFPTSTRAQPVTVATIFATTAFASIWERIFKRFRAMLNRRAFIHWYLLDGMEMDSFIEASEKLNILIEHYHYLDT